MKKLKKKKKAEPTVVEMMDKMRKVVPHSTGASAAGWHSIESFLRCPKEYQFQHVRKIHEPRAQTPDHFAVGQLFHVAKAHWFSCGFATDEKTMTAIRKLVAEAALLAELPITLKAEQLTLRYFEEYVAFWLRRPQPTVLAAEYDIGPAPLEAGDPFFLYRTARLDDVSKYPEAGGKLCIGESKTTSASINDCVNQYTLHGQPMLQVLLWKFASQGEAMHGPVAGVMLDVIQKGYDAPCKFSRVFVPVTDHMLNWYAQSMRGYLRAAMNVDWNVEVPRNVSACTRMVGRGRFACAYRELCMYGRSASIKYVFKGGKGLLTWKPTDDKSTPPWA